MPSTWLPNIHVHQQKFLLSSLRHGNLAHAYMLYGPQSVRKRDIAKRFAQTILCDTSNQVPCGSCSACSIFLRLRHPDVLTVKRQDQTRNIGIDQIRQINRFVQFRSTLGSAKICLLFDAGSMNLAAANAFLKTLEEPPSSVILILVADTPFQLPATVLSRCQLLRFSQLQKDRSSSELESKALVYSKSMELLKVNLFDKLSLAQKILEVTSTARDEKFDSDRPSVSDLINSLEVHLRDMLLAKMLPDDLVRKRYKRDLRSIAHKYSLSKIQSLINTVSHIRESMRYNANIRLALDHFLIQSEI